MERWVCFNHGKESGPWGAKIRRLADDAEALGYRVMSPDYRGLDLPEARVERLLEVLPEEPADVILVGSSMGAHVAMAASARRRIEGLFLLAPAVYLPGYPTASLQPRAGRTLVVHGWEDELIPPTSVVRFCQEHEMPLLLLAGDHRLLGPLEAIGRQFRLFLEGRQSTSGEFE